MSTEDEHWICLRLYWTKIDFLACTLSPVIDGVYGPFFKLSRIFRRMESNGIESDDSFKCNACSSLVRLPVRPQLTLFHRFNARMSVYNTIDGLIINRVHTLLLLWSVKRTETGGGSSLKCVRVCVWANQNNGYNLPSTVAAQLLAFAAQIFVGAFITLGLMQLCLRYDCNSTYHKTWIPNRIYFIFFFSLLLVFHFIFVCITFDCEPPQFRACEWEIGQSEWVGVCARSQKWNTIHYVKVQVQAREWNERGSRCNRAAVTKWLYGVCEPRLPTACIL